MHKRTYRRTWKDGDIVPLLPRERQAAILARIREEGFVHVADLVRELAVSDQSVRRDLEVLVRRRLIERVHGGATLLARSALFEPANQRVASPNLPAFEAKRRIAVRAAAEFVEDGQTIVVSSGTTTLQFARCLVDRRLTVITNALDVAGVLVDCDAIELIVLGGVVRPIMHSMLGHLAELATRELRADVLFMGIGAISLEHGLMNDSIPEILTDRALRRIARKAVVLADSSKFDLVASGFVCRLEEIDALVTDAGVRDADVAGLEARSVQVVIAD